MQIHHALQRISGHFALVKRVKEKEDCHFTTKDPDSIELSLASWLREAISLKAMGEVENRYTDAILRTRISSTNTQEQVSYQWRMLVGTLMGPSFSCALGLNPILMAHTLCLAL